MNPKMAFLGGVILAALCTFTLVPQSLRAQQGAAGAPGPAQPAARPAQPAPEFVRPAQVSPAPNPQPPVPNPQTAPWPYHSGLNKVDVEEVPKPDPKAFPKIAEEEPGTFAPDREYLRRFSYPRSTIKIKVTVRKDIGQYNPIEMLDMLWRQRQEYGATIPQASESVYNPSGPSPRPTPIFSLPGQ